MSTLKDKIEISIKQNESLNPNDVWENDKLIIQSSPSKYSAEQAKSKREELNNLTKQLQGLIDDQCTSLIDNSEELNRIKIKIEGIYERTKGSIFHSRARWYNSKYFYSSEKQRFNNRTMTCVVLPDGHISKKQKYILAMQSQFYQKIYKSNSEVEIYI